MTAILTEIGNPTDPAVIQLLVSNPALDVGTVLSFDIRSADSRRREFPVLSLSESVPYPIMLWDWLQLIHIKYDYECAYSNVGLPKAEQISDIDYRQKVRPRGKAEYVKVENLVFTPVYATVEPNPEQPYTAINDLLNGREWRECPTIALITNTRVTSTADRRIVSNGDVRVVREYLF